MGNHIDTVRDTYFNDPYVTDYEYALMLEEARLEEYVESLEAELPEREDT